MPDEIREWSVQTYRDFWAYVALTHDDDLPSNPATGYEVEPVYELLHVWLGG